MLTLSRVVFQDGGRDDDSERGVSGARRHLGGARGGAASQGQNSFWNKKQNSAKNVNSFDQCRILTVVKEAQQYFGIPTYMHKHRLSSCK